ncbi:hypothetical protein L207DRAFT_591968 [Hyaloscypha variabilis F]|uniref:Transcription factor domain-containing protein n=1 Tax=Hyaloscypha variabilis (strain UAMH 11265 / GT02V1 / F) TaxID=1149755 RepID=A0A2J6QXP6_HYAVF|nr:hypothetical protein L207DRAFT_591968 [Hyaloscypha variabilis F]
MTPRCRDLVYKFILNIGEAINQSTLCCQAVDVSASIWIQYIFQDKAYFHQAVATSLKYNNSEFEKGGNAAESLRHLSNAISLINNKIAGKDALSDTTIAAIVGLIGHERFQNQHQTSMIHFKGLQRIIELRGGIPCLMTNAHLVDKIFRVDIEFALYNGTTTQFHIKDVPGQILSELRTTMRHNKEQQMVNWNFTKLLIPDLQDVLSDILILAYVLNNHEKVPMKLNAYSYQQIVILVSYRLIQISQLATPRLTSDLENMIHLALTAFTTTLFLGFGSVALKALLLVKLLRELAQRFQAHDAETQKVLLWVLFMGRASVFNDLGDWWIVPKIREICIDLNLRTWEDVRNILSRFPWVGSVHGQSGRSLWEKSEDNYILLS